MKNNNKKLLFNKQSLVELNENEIKSIQGGTSIDMLPTGCVCNLITRTLDKNKLVQN